MAASTADAAAEESDGQSDVPSSNASAAEPDGWNSDDEPPKDHIGDGATCCRDGGVKKFIRRVGVSFEQPGQYDIVVIRWRPLPPPKPPQPEGTPAEGAPKAEASSVTEAVMEELEVPLSEDRLPLAVECAVRKMRLGEVSEVVGPAAYSAKASPLSGRRLRKASLPKGGKVPRDLRFMPRAPHELFKEAQVQTKSKSAPPHFRVEVELVRIDSVLVFTEDACVRKQVVKIGDGRRRPKTGDLVTFSTRAESTSDGEQHKVVLGEGKMPYTGLEHILQSMLEEECCLARFLPKASVSKTDTVDAKVAVAEAKSEEGEEQRIFVTMHYIQRRDTVAVHFPGIADDACPILKKLELRRGPERWTYAIEDGSDVLIALVALRGTGEKASVSQITMLSWCIGEGVVPKYMEAAVTGMRCLEVAEFRTSLETMARAPVGPAYEGQSPLRRALVPEALPLVNALFELCAASGEREGELPPLAISLPDTWRSAGDPVKWDELAVEPPLDSSEEIVFRVAMVAGSEAPDICLLEESEQNMFLQHERGRGGALVKAGRFPEATAAYNKALDTVRHTPVYKGLFPTRRGHIKGAVTRDEGTIEALKKLTEEEVAGRRSNLVALHLNLALCAGKSDNYADVRFHTTTVLGADPENVKALFRRGAAASINGDYELALPDLQKAAALQPQDKAVRSELADIRCKLKKQEESDKAMFAKAFKPKPRPPKQDDDDDDAMPELEDVSCAAGQAVLERAGVLGPK